MLNEYLESAKRHIEEELSGDTATTDGASPYSVQPTTQEQPETQRELSKVKEAVQELVQQNSQVLPIDFVQTLAGTL